MKMEEYMKAISLRKHVKKQPLVTLNDTDTVGNALSLFKRKGITSAPIKNTSRKSSEEVLLGLVGVADIVYYVLSLVPKLDSITPEELKKMFITSELIEETSVYNIIDKSRLNPLVELYETDTALQLFLSVLKKGVHRIVLVNGDNVAMQTMSRSDIIKLVAEGIKKGELDKIGEVQVGDMIKRNDNIVSVKDTDNILACLTNIKASGHKSIPVVNDQNQLVGNFSCSDIHRVNQDLFIEFHTQVSKFSTNKPISLKMTDTLETVVSTMVQPDRSVHCIWVVDDEDHVIGSVSMTDVLRYLSKL
mmetsp:Transcript_13832/g.20949  ORF Transcript_13832/g.20949 Transcript_13832/m.20949 type:complete len:304 (+) Transcript_13832:36-947(+)